MSSRKPRRQYLTVPEVAEMLGVGRNKVFAWIKSGDIIATDLSQDQGTRPRWRIALDDLERFVKSRRSSPTPQLPARRKAKRGVVEFVR